MFCDFLSLFFFPKGSKGEHGEDGEIGQKGDQVRTHFIISCPPRRSNTVFS